MRKPLKKSRLGIFSFFSCAKTNLVKSHEPIDSRTESEKFLLLVENVLCCYDLEKNSLLYSIEKITDKKCYHELKEISDMKNICDDAKIFQLKKKLHEYRLEKLIALFEKFEDNHEHSYFESLLIQSGLIKLPLDMKEFAEKCIECTVEIIEKTSPSKHAPF